MTTGASYFPMVSTFPTTFTKIIIGTKLAFSAVTAKSYAIRTICTYFHTFRANLCTFSTCVTIGAAYPTVANKTSITIRAIFNPKTITVIFTIMTIRTNFNAIFTSPTSFAY